MLSLNAKTQMCHLQPGIKLRKFYANPFLVVATGDINAKSSNWFSQDKTRFEGDPIKKFNIPIWNTSGY